MNYLQDGDGSMVCVIILSRGWRAGAPRARRLGGGVRVPPA